ncbi:energy-coupling factor transporter ATPase [Brevibacillus sp. SYP-B805]|uniref:energy-coupling factor transporter ATPase n=1 Tax=Brevibacillus sp. SYP-B805 TaxID=1578199 RepID=UPI0013EDE316|nr:energy-coupling factor transporter ATPase [Brevibacillus sp. SYP-B805]NGQ97214.1 energy-coupling factor transporter ATPase [Brevibacillus sp. SYP-B805]
MEEKPIVAFRNVSFSYQNEAGENVPVLEQLNLEIHPGTYVAILGHNGSGKSTMAKLMNALLLPSEGHVLVNGCDTRELPRLAEIRRTVGMVFQNPDNQIVGTTVEDDVAFGLENLGLEPREMRKRIDQALQAVQMQGYEKRQPHRLSGGQKQRIAIAGIIAMHPSVIILDEATAMLDPQGRQEVCALVRRLNREEGVTVINITHFPEEALDAHRVVVMKQGAVYMDGSPAEVFAQVERLQEAGLDVPYAVRLRHDLAKEGVVLPSLLHQEELVVELCKLLLKT